MAATELAVAARDILGDAMDRMAVAVVDTGGVILAWSRGCETLYGWTAAEAIGRSKRDLLNARWNGAPASWPPVPDCAIHEMRRDGSVVVVAETMARVDDGRDGPHFALWSTEASTRTPAEAQRSDVASRLALALDMDVIGIFDYDARHRTIRWTHDAWHATGMSHGTMSVAEFHKRVGPDRVGELSDRIRRAADAGDTWIRLLVTIDLPRGRSCVIDLAGQLHYDDAGRLARIFGVVHDVTERHRHTIALAARDAELGSILDTVPDTIVVATAAGVIRAFSRNAETLLGHRAGDAIGSSVATFLSKDWNDVRDTATMAEPCVTKAIHADGGTVTVEIRVGRVASCAPPLFVLFIRDLSDRIADAERRDLLIDQFNLLSRATAISEYAAHLTHELSQPLMAVANVIGAARELVARGAPTTRIAEMLEIASTQTVRAGDILRRMFEFATRRESIMRPMPVETAIDEAVALALGGYGQYDVALTRSLDPAAPVMFVDAIQIQQVLANLLRNSMHALRECVDGPPPGIRVTARAAADGMIEIGVEDNGPGIAASMLTRLFEPFQSTKAGEGVGLGLAICRTIVEAHGGTMTAENRPGGRGARVCFTVPSIEATRLESA